ncbi:MAG: class I SAM-dependent methyltransferase [Nitrospirota bacterium]
MARMIHWTPELIGRFWSGVSQTRLREYNFSRVAAPYLIELVGGHLKPQGRHLDFGAGEGDLVRALVERGFATAAYEPVVARRLRIPGEMSQHPQYLGVVQDGGPERFDVVLMVEVIEHILDEELEGAFQKVRSFLVEGGTLIVTTPNAEDLELGSAYCPMCETLFHRWQHVRSFTPDRLTEFLRRQGFSCLFLHQVDFSDQRFPIEALKAIKRRQDEEERAAKAREERRLVKRLKRFIRGQKLVAENPEPLAEESKNLLVGSQSHLVYIGVRS